MSDHDTIPPIHRLPKELLLIIFEHVAYARFYADSEGRWIRKAERNISMTCSLWYTLCWDSPLLWTNVQMIAPGAEFYDRHHPPQYFRALRKEAPALPGSDVALNVALGFYTERPDMSILTPLLAKCGQWERLDVKFYDDIHSATAPDSGADIIVPALQTGGRRSESKLARLSYLGLQYVHDDRIADALLQAPNLRTVITESFSVLVRGKGVTRPLKKLECLHVELDRYRHRLLQFRRRLANSADNPSYCFPALKHLSISTVPSPNFQQDGSVYYGRLSDDYSFQPSDFPSYINYILRRLEFHGVPSLSSLCLTWQDSSEFRAKSKIPYLSFHPLHTFLMANGSVLSCLSITNLMLRPTELEDVLMAVPALQSLQITEADMLKVGAWPRTVEMITPSFLTFLTVSDSNSNPPPLPQLKHIDFKVNVFHDEAMISILRSRSITSPGRNQKQCVRLRSVALTLHGLRWDLEWKDSIFLEVVPSLRSCMTVNSRDREGCVISRFFPSPSSSS